MRRSLLAALGALVAVPASAFSVDIKDSDDVREVCSGMFGGDKAWIEVSFAPRSAGQVALVMYEWADAGYLGKTTPPAQDGAARPKTYVCTNSAMSAGLCTTSDVGQFLLSLPEDKDVSDTSIYTAALRFSGSGARHLSGRSGLSSIVHGRSPQNDVATPQDEADETDDIDEATPAEETAPPPEEGKPMTQEPDKGDGHAPETPITKGVVDYTTPIHRHVTKTGYYCIGVVPVTLIGSRDLSALDVRAATHANFSGVVTFRNQFDGELPAVEYPKIGFYGFMSLVYLILAIGWGVLCARHYRELLPMQYYISGTIAFLVVEMLALFAYYRYINKHGGGAASIAFLVVVSVLNAARNSLSFFLLLIVSMGLSVVTPSLGTVMLRVWALTALHFIFGVMYSVGTVKVELDSANVLVVLILIFPLSFTLTAYLMWIIVSLNGTILHLQERKQNFKLQMFRRLYRILITAVIAVAGFFVLSSISLSNRLDEGYAPGNWRWRWILLDASLATIYLAVFVSIAWLWRPTSNNRMFAMSTELAQEDADAEDYEIDELEAQRHGLAREDSREFVHGEPPAYGDEDEEERKKLFTQERRGTIGANDDNVVFSMGDASDSEDDDERTGLAASHSPVPGGSRGGSRRNSGGYRDSEDSKAKAD